jgi:hypothetical protein
MEYQQVLPKAELWLYQWRMVNARGSKIIKDYNTAKETILKELLWKALWTTVCEEEEIFLDLTILVLAVFGRLTLDFKESASSEDPEH